MTSITSNNIFSDWRSYTSLINVIFWICYVILIIIGTEIFGYLWHRYGAHNDYVGGVYDTHCIHHISNASNEADEDFIWVLLLIMMFELMAGLAVLFGVVNGMLVIIAISVSLVVFWWNWWIHKAYHQDDHWLNSYEWFQTEKRRHYTHHIHPENNYGIASHFTDMLMGTWYPE